MVESIVKALTVHRFLTQVWCGQLDSEFNSAKISSFQTKFFESRSRRCSNQLPSGLEPLRENGRLSFAKNSLNYFSRGIQIDFSEWLRAVCVIPPHQKILQGCHMTMSDQVIGLHFPQVRLTTTSIAFLCYHNLVPMILQNLLIENTSTLV